MRQHISTAKLKGIIVLGVFLLVSAIHVNIKAQVSYDYSNSVYGVSNPGGLNTQADDYVSTTAPFLKWTAVTISGLSATTTSSINKWSNRITIPFNFYFYGEPVNSCVASLNGLVSFTTSNAGTIAPIVNNTALPSSSIPNKTIACFWDAFTGKDANDWIYTKTFGTAPNRQFWIKWYSMKTSRPASANNGWALVFEESTNRIYVVDQYRNSTTAITATIGMQYDASYYSNYSSSRPLSSSSTAYSNNITYLFTPSRIAYADLEYDYADLSGTLPLTNYMVRDLSVPCASPYSLEKAVLKLQLDVGDDYEYGKNTFSSSVTVNIKGYNTARAQILSTSSAGITKQLQISEAAPEQLYYIDITDFNTSYSYTDLDVLTFSISSATIPTTIQNGIRLRAWIETEYNVGVEYRTTYTSSSSFINTPAVNASQNPVAFTWNSICSDLPYQEFQLLRLYNTDESYGEAEVYTDPINWSNALSFILDGSTRSLDLVLAEGTGYYAWRVRAIGNYYEGDVANSQNWGSWTTHTSVSEGTQYDSRIAAASNYVFYFSQPEDGKNWIYNRVFTEDARIAENITYADELLRIRQTQHKIQSDGNTLVGQILYDYSGRDAMKSLASPLSSSNLAFQQRFLQNGGSNYTADDFDTDANYNNPNTVDGGSLTEYYSNTNPDLSIPTAQQYPFNRTLFDGSGRVREMGSAGEIYRIGGGSADGISRTIKNYYVSASDPEIIKVFANEAYDQESVRKIITVDPNKVTTITYQTVEGKVIATCLSAESGLTEGLDYEPTTISKTINFNSQQDAYTFEKSDNICLTEATTVYVYYSLTPDQIEADCGSYCSSCDYSVEIYVRNTETNTNVFDTSFTYGPSACGVLDSQIMPERTIPLDPGTFSIGRIIRVNNDENLNSHLDEVDEDMDENIENSYGNLITLLEAGDFEGFKDLLTTSTSGGGYGLSSSDIEDGDVVTLNTGCCPISFTIDECSLPCDDGTPGFEEMLYRRWGEQYGYTPNQYFNNIYEDAITGYNEASIEFSDLSSMSLGGECPASITLQIELTYPDGSTDTLDLLDGENTCLSVSAGASANDIMTAVIDSRANTCTPYGICIGTLYDFTTTGIPMNTLLIKCNTTGIGAPVSARIICESRGFTTTVNQDDLSATYSGSYRGDGYGIWDAMIGHMINGVSSSSTDVYSCDTLWYIWNSLVESWESMQFDTDASGEIVKNDYDLREAFLNAAGKQYGGISNFRTSYIVDGGYSSGYYGWGYDEYAFKSYYCDTITATEAAPGDLEECRDMTISSTDIYADGPFVIDGTINWPADNRFEDGQEKTWEQFYSCIHGDEDLAASSSSLSSSGIVTLDCDVADADCIQSIVAALEDSCETYCGYRYSSFLFEAQQMFESEGKSYCQGDLDCVASQLEQECIKACDLTIYFQDADGDGVYENGEVLDSVGSPQEIQNYTEALTYSMDVVSPADCDASYVTVSSGLEYFSGGVAEDLNNYLTTLLASGSTAIDHYQIIAELKSLYYDFACDSFKCSIEEVKAAYPIVALSNFEVNASNQLVLHYFGGSLTIFDFDLGCNPSHECSVCYKWQPLGDIITSLVQDTIVAVSCEEHAASSLLFAITNQLDDCKNDEHDAFEESYTNTCASASSIEDVLSYRYNVGYHHYTLYYYDRLGRLVKTVPPKGVDDDNTTRNEVTDHSFETTYEYNSLGQLLTKTSPDGGSTNYYYNAIGQLRYSQNAQQTVDNKYSYVKYDALGRIVEAGQAEICSSCDMTSVSDLSLNVNESNFPSTGEQRVYTVYSTAHASAIYDDNNGNTETQKYLINRVSYSYNDAGVYTYYSYDPHGNVSWMIQQLPVLGMKYIKYEYDLVSGKVTEVKFNENRVDQFYHRYSYDEDNRLTQTETSRDGYIWDIDARYEYYAYGPLKRVELGEDKVQGLDYVYTIQGWLKSINDPRLDATYDAGQDGGTLHPDVAPDAFGMILNYHSGDFDRSGSNLNNQTQTFLSSLSNDDEVHNSYYTGIISNVISNNGYTGSDVQNANMPMAGMYLYDDLGRLVQSTIDFYSGSAWQNNNGSASDYYEHFIYDDNGNITNVTRNGY